MGIGAKKLENAREMSKLVKNRGIKRTEKAAGEVKTRSKALLHAFFRTKAQKDSSLMHKKGFSGRVRKERGGKIRKDWKIRKAEPRRTKVFEAVSRF